MSSTHPPISARTLLPGSAARRRLRRWRTAKDHLSRGVVATAGIGVVIALATIFFYLLSEVAPVFRSASVELEESYALPGGAQDETLHIATERYVEVAVRFSRSGAVTFFEPEGGAVRKRFELAIPDGVEVTSFGVAEPRSGYVAYGLSDGRALVVRHAYDITYPDDVRHTEPKLEFPFGEAPVEVRDDGRPLTAITVQHGRTGISVAAASGADITLARYAERTHFLTGETVVEREAYALTPAPFDVDRLLVDSAMRNLFAASRDGRVSYYDTSTPEQTVLRETRRVIRDPQASLTALNFLLGTVSLVAGGSDGSVSQWFLVRDADNISHLTFIRDFDRHEGAVLDIRPEHSRKGFATTDDTGELAVRYSTSSRTVFHQRVLDGPVPAVAIAPRNDTLLYLDGDGTLYRNTLWNEHPQISMSALWSKVWYEGRSAPEYVWQSSSATDEFESKFSMVPLSIGTLKAAFYAMLFAMPLAILGAIYSAYFMTPRLRGFVKPTIEVMEALPTVILGFLAGLWLAPFMENNLPAVFSVVLLLPVVVLGFAWLWGRLPQWLRYRVPPGWEAALLVVPVVAVGWFGIAMSPLFEVWFFGGDMRQWLTDVGINYDQRNAMVVGVAMGFAVIPTIFSIAEDAVFTVPKHLTQGSLALGATQWQTVTRVVLLTASPGIFSAVMIGFGRAVGETMIVLMATGNSPVVNFNLFEGMRTLSANIAVELPETAVGSSHFRILFLAALLLFAVTFLLNTVAEVVRQRLRRKYSQL